MLMIIIISVISFLKRSSSSFGEYEIFGGVDMKTLTEQKEHVSEKLVTIRRNCWNALQYCALSSLFQYWSCHWKWASPLLLQFSAWLFRFILICYFNTAVVQELICEIDFSSYWEKDRWLETVISSAIWFLSTAAKLLKLREEKVNQCLQDRAGQREKHS